MARQGDKFSLVHEVSQSSLSTNDGKVEKGLLSNEHVQQSPKEPWWLTVGGFMVFFNIWGLPITFGAFQDFYTLEYLPGYSASTISWIGTIQSALLVLVGLFSGPMYDLGYWRHLLISGCFLTVFGMMMLSLSTEYYQILLSQGVCVGIGCGLLYVPVLSTIGAAFSRKRALAMGLITSGIALGAVAFTAMYLRLLPALGFAWTVRIMGFVNLAAFLIAIPPLFRSKKTPTPARKLWDKAILKNTHFLIFTLAQFFMLLGYLVPLVYIPIFAQAALHADEATALYVLIGSQAGSLVGRLAAAAPVPRTGVMLPWLLCCAASGVLCFAWLGVSDLAGLVAFAVLYGVFSGGLVALPPSLFPTLCPDPTKLGSQLGASWTFSSIGLLVGAPIAGAIIDIQARDFRGVQIWSGVMLLFSGLIVALLWILLARKHGKVLI